LAGSLFIDLNPSKVLRDSIKKCDPGSTYAGLGKRLAHSGCGQAVGLGIELAADVRDGELKGAGQLAADPVKRMKARATAGVFPIHLPDYDLRVGVNVKCFGFKRYCILKGFKQGNIFSHVVVLASNPFGDSDPVAIGALDNYANPGRTRISQAPAVNISDKSQHKTLFLSSTMRQ